MVKKMIVALGILLLIGTLIVSSHSTVRADSKLWFVSWIPNDSTIGNYTYSYTVTWADTQQSIVTITTDWGDGTSSDSVVSTGTLNPMFTLPTYTASVQTYHDYKIVGTFSHTIILTDSLGNGASQTVSVIVIQHNGPIGVYGAGGRTPTKM